MKKVSFRLTAIFITIASLLLLVIWWNFLHKPLIRANQGFRYIFQTGSTLETLVNDLSQQHIIKHPTLFKIFLHIRSNPRKLKAGEYYFPPGITFSQLIEQIATGHGMIYHAFTIVSGWDMRELRKSLNQENSLLHTINSLKDEEIMKILGDNNEMAEGQFFPDTYYYTLGATDVSLLKRAHQLLNTKLNKAWEERDEGLPFLNRYQALIAASLVEKEAYLNTEKTIIAGVLINRLRKNMLLQFDPTVIYGLGAHYKGEIHRKDLMKNTPFNTYVHKGLPPTPISMVSMDAIQATLHPANHDFLYFVAKGDGSHQFSETLMEHHKAVLDAVAKKIKN